MKIVEHINEIQVIAEPGSLYPGIGRRKLNAYIFVKRVLDIGLSVVGLIATLPLFVLLALLIKVEDRGGRVFFRQDRVGIGGKLFKIYKFRTMAAEAEQRLKADPMLYAKYINNNYKLEPEEDPRITKIGRFLRRTSLDEIPQLLNVLKGDMSLVGPRPVVQEELNEYAGRIHEFLSVKPGITGYWQVSGRSTVGYPERVEIELVYVRNQSFLLDMFILLKTIRVVFAGNGAY